MALHRAEDRYAIRQTADQLADLQTVMRLIDVVVEAVIAETSVRPSNACFPRSRPDLLPRSSIVLRN